MTTDDSLDEAAFDAFLARRDGLSDELRKVGQPALPVALREKVMADIESELARETAVHVAANDATNPESGARPSLMQRWRVPAAFAASVLVGVIAHAMWKRDASSDVVAQLERIREEVKAEEARVREEAPLPATPAETVAAGPTAAEKQKETIPIEGKTPVAQPASSVPVATAPHVAEKPKAAPLAVARAEPQTVTVTGIRASLQQSMSIKRNAETHVEAITAEDVGKMPDKNVADSLQRMPGVSIASSGDPALDAKRSADTHIEVATGLSPADEAAPQRYVPAPRAQAAAPVQPPLPAADGEHAKAWLESIGKKIEAGQAQDALDEWEKFRKAYPAYVVPGPLLEKIKTIKKE